ncbi:hypothetical protein [Azospirillum sp.]|uniref:hypothetical protein n=1 Tax=Azospirillum sp. TaxID=34012 RepID=UPI002619D21B|nr:hypothetical protein [Azospirillum sp.]
MTRLMMILAVLLMVLAAPVAAQQSPVPSRRETLIIFAPHFVGADHLGKTAANLVRLQISSTFQEAGTNTRALMVFGEYQLPASSHQDALQYGLRPDIAAHLVLWGDVYQLSDGVAIQAVLSVTPRLTEREKRPEAWLIPVRDHSGNTLHLFLALPRPLYRLPPILVSTRAALEYGAIMGTPIFDSIEMKKKIGTVGSDFRAYKYEKGAVYLLSNGVTGWVGLKYVSEEQNLIMNFSGAVMRLIRGDYGGASTLLDSVLRESRLPIDLMTDTLLLRGLVDELRNRSGLPYFIRAQSASPLDRVTASYLLMGRIAEAQRATGDRKRSAVQTLSADLVRTRRLFPAAGNWIRLVEEYVASGE